MIPKLEYDALLQALAWLKEFPGFGKPDGSAGKPDGVSASPLPMPALPAAMPAKPEEDEGFLKQLHTAIFELILVDGKLVCPESGREFPVNDGIPNMLLNDDEV